jgi:hypothetical protein
VASATLFVRGEHVFVLLYLVFKRIFAAFKRAFADTLLIS